MAYNDPAGPTEVEQAVFILKKMNAKITVIMAAIESLYYRTQEVLYRNEDVKKEAVYAWLDYDLNKNPINHHLVRVKIDGYPSREDFPHRVTKREWLDFWKCSEVTGTTGSFKTTVSRYDGDIPSLWWNFRRTKNKLDSAVLDQHKQNIKAIKDDILSDGRLSNAAALEDVLKDAIESITIGTYGPEKSNIGITKEK
jgi:hypothetical protein